MGKGQKKIKGQSPRKREKTKLVFIPKIISRGEVRHLGRLSRGERGKKLFDRDDFCGLERRAKMNHDKKKDGRNRPSGATGLCEGFLIQLYVDPMSRK